MTGWLIASLSSVLSFPKTVALLASTAYNHGGCLSDSVLRLICAQEVLKTGLKTCLRQRVEQQVGKETIKFN